VTSFCTLTINILQNYSFVNHTYMLQFERNKDSNSFLSKGIFL
jgi:hypothetical protein